MPSVKIFFIRSHTLGRYAPMLPFDGNERFVCNSGGAGLLTGASLLSSSGWKADGPMATSLPTGWKSPGLKEISPLCSFAMRLPYGAGTPAVGFPFASTFVTMTRLPSTIPMEPIFTGFC